MTKYKTILRLALIITTALILRLYHIGSMGYRFADEGYHLLHPIILTENPDYPSLYFKHGLMWWIYLGLHLFGFTVNGSLYFSIFCGTISVVLFYLICSRLMRGNYPLYGAALFAFSYYIFYYQRSNMSDGYALMFFCLTGYLFITAVQKLGIMPVFSKGKRSPFAFIVLVASGLLLGFTFTVRIQTCLTLIGAGGAFAVVLLIKVFLKKKKPEIFFKYSGTVLLWCLTAVIGYSVFMLLIRHHIKWDDTLKWYGKNATITAIPPEGWHLFICRNLWHLCGLPFLVISAIGIVRDIYCFKKLNSFRLWLLICFAGLTAGYVKAAMPWPRAYLYLIVFMIFYWLVGADCIAGIFKKMRKDYVVTSILFITIVFELMLIIPFINKRSGYNDATAFINQNEHGALIATHSWPIFEALPYRHDNFLINKECRNLSTTGQFMNHLRYMFVKRRARYMILDNNIYFFPPPNPDMLKYFCRKNRPTAVYKNDFGEDYHTCMDAFGRAPVHEFCTDRIMIYRFRKPEKR